MPDRYVHFNGALVPVQEARVPIDDGAWLHGAGLFETVRVEHGRPFRWDVHVRRLQRSAAALLAPVADADLPSGQDVQRLLEKNGLRAARLRLTVSAGSMQAAEADKRPTVCLTATDLVPYDAALYDKGVAVILSPYRQCTTDPLAGHKTACYLPRLLALRRAHNARCQEALWFTEQNHLAEGCISNVLVVREGKLLTPPLDTPVLPGVARAAVLELAQDAGLLCEERRLDINDLLDADEVLLTSTIMLVLPVIRVEKRDIKGAKVGPVAHRLLEAFQQLIKKECGPA